MEKIKNNEYAIMNIETLAHNVACYASYFDREDDLFGEIDEAVQKAENALLELADTMKLYQKKKEEKS